MAWRMHNEMDEKPQRLFNLPEVKLSLHGVTNSSPNTF